MADQFPLEEFFHTTCRTTLLSVFIEAGVAGLGGAVFPTAAKNPIG